MKNKLRLIDVSLLSSYMGKGLTVIVTVFVVGIAVSALVDGGGFERSIIRVCVRAESGAGEATEAYEPFRVLLSRETRRPVVITECGDGWPSGYDLYVMSVDSYFAREKALGISALFEVTARPGSGDKAIIIRRSAPGGVELSGARRDDIAFSHPLSVNGFWVQAEALARSGSDLTAEPGGPRFEGSRWDASRVVHGVIFGAFAFGSCKLSEVLSLSEKGAIDMKDIRTVYSSDALPEIVLAADRDEAEYFMGKIGAIAKELAEAPAPSPQGDTVKLLKRAGVAGFEPIADARLDRLRSLFERFGRDARSVTAVSP
jgi:ABC-type phosphate/phosphonate transport system substrate-binding protein